MYICSKPYLHSFYDTIVDKNKMLMLSERGSIYNLITDEILLNLKYTPEVTALKDDILVSVYKTRIYIYKLSTKECFKLKYQIEGIGCSIYYGEYLAIGCYNGKLYIFNQKFEFFKYVKMSFNQVVSINYCRTGLIAIGINGEVLCLKNGKFRHKKINTYLSALTIKDHNEKEGDIFNFKRENKDPDSIENLQVLLGDIYGFLYFISYDLNQIHRVRISEKEISFLFFFRNIYYISDKFVRKLNKNGNKIYGTVCADPEKIFVFEDKVFCNSFVTGVVCLEDRKEDLYDKVMKFE